MLPGLCSMCALRVVRVSLPSAKSLSVKQSTLFSNARMPD